MIDYSKSKIYKISDINNEMVYIGSTAQKYLCSRMACHRCNFVKNRKQCSSFLIFEKYGMDNCKIELLEVFPCKTKDELLIREGFYIQSMECINKCIAGRTKAEYRATHKDQIKIYYDTYYQKNRQVVLDKCKKYNLAHAEDITNYNIEYRATHKDKIKTYRDDHKVKMSAYQLAYRQAKKANIIDV